MRESHGRLLQFALIRVFREQSRGGVSTSCVQRVSGASGRGRPALAAQAARPDQITRPKRAHTSQRPRIMLYENNCRTASVYGPTAEITSQNRGRCVVLLRQNFLNLINFSVGIFHNTPDCYSARLASNHIKKNRWNGPGRPLLVIKNWSRYHPDCICSNVKIHTYLREYFLTKFDFFFCTPKLIGMILRQILLQELATRFSNVLIYEIITLTYKLTYIQNKHTYIARRNCKVRYIIMCYVGSIHAIVSGRSGSDRHVRRVKNRLCQRPTRLNGAVARRVPHRQLRTWLTT